jgi:hypothetical protein
MGMNTEFWLENMEGRSYLGVVEEGKMILLKCILKTRELNVTVSEEDPVKGFCKHGYELSVQEFLDLPTNYEILKSCFITLVHETCYLV